MFIIACVYFGLALLIFIFFVAEPREVGIDMQDDHKRATVNAEQD